MNHDWKSMGYASLADYLVSLAETDKCDRLKAESDKKERDHQAWLRLCGVLQATGIGRLR
jgi:hypothetical protein